MLHGLVVFGSPVGVHLRSALHQHCFADLIPQNLSDAAIVIAIVRACRDKLDRKCV